MAINIPNKKAVQTTVTDDSDIPNSITNSSLGDLYVFPPDVINYDGDDVDDDFNYSANGNKRLAVYQKNSTFKDNDTGIDINFDFRQSGTVYHQVLEFDMRGTCNVMVKGAKHTLETQFNHLLHRLAAKYQVSLEQVVFWKDTRNAFSCAAIIDEAPVLYITLFIQLDSNTKHNYRCLTISSEATTQALVNIIGSHHPVRPFCNYHRLSEATLSSQGITSGSNIQLIDIRPEYFKCLYRASPKFQQVYIVESTTTDTIHELKQNIRKTIGNVSPENPPIPEHIISSYMWLTCWKRLYADGEYLAFLEKSDDDDDSYDHSDNSSDYFDFIIHFQSEFCIPVTVTYRIGDARTSCVEIVIVPCDASSDQLREQIAKLLQCSQNGLKMIVNGKKLPEWSDLSTFQDFKSMCTIYASIKRPITVTVTLQDSNVKLSIMKPDLVFVLKKKLADRMKTIPRKIKLSFEGTEPNDSHRIGQANIKDNSSISAEVVEERIVMSIRKRCIPITHLTVDMFQDISVRDLKNFYRHVIKLRCKSDIELHMFNSVNPFGDNTMLLRDVGIEDMTVLYATEIPECDKLGDIIKIFQCLKIGSTDVRYGVITGGQIFYGNAPADTDNQETKDAAYEMHSTCDGIRMSHPFELEDTELVPTTPEIENTESVIQQVIVPWIECPRSPSTKRQFSYTFPNMYHFEHVQPSFKKPYPIPIDPPGVISDHHLNKLAQELPGSSWQIFVRSLGVPNTIVSKHTESYPRNISEAIYQCLNSWKLREGRNATKQMIQSALCDNGLRLIFDTVFGYDTK